MHINSLSNLTMLQSYSDRPRNGCYSLTEHEKVALITFPLRDSILCLSGALMANMNEIRDKVMKVLKDRTSDK